MSSVPTLAPHGLAGELGLSIQSPLEPGSRTMILQQRVQKGDRTGGQEAYGKPKVAHMEVGLMLSYSRRLRWNEKMALGQTPSLHSA